MDSHSKPSAPDGLIRCPSCNRKVVLNNSNLPHFFCPACHAEITHDIIILFDEAERIGKQKLEQARLKQASRAKAERAEREEEHKKEEERRKEEEQHFQEECQNTTQELKLHLKSEGDYIGLEVNLRRKSEKFFKLIASKAIDEWHPFEAELFRLLINFPKRKECLSLAEDNVGENKHLLTELKKLNGLMETLVQGQDRTKGDDATGGIGLGIGVSIPLGDSSDD